MFFRLGPVAIAGLFICQAFPVAHAQLRVLSPGDEAQQWRKAQIEILEQQARASERSGPLRQELDAQLKWLTHWQPDGLDTQPLWTGHKAPSPWEEPTLDPTGLAKQLRQRLFGPEAKPTPEDTRALRSLLSEHPADVGVRQLHLQWLDQLQFRKQYPDEIAAAALYLLGLIEQLEPQTEETKRAKAFCLYRRGRALAYRELPEVVAKSPIEEPEQHAGQLLGAYEQLTSLLGRQRPEFILLDIRMLRRDKWYGQALALLEEHAESIPARWFLKKRRDLLQELGWDAAYSEAASIYAREFPQEAAQEWKQDVDEPAANRANSAESQR